MGLVQQIEWQNKDQNLISKQGNDLSGDDKEKISGIRSYFFHKVPHFCAALVVVQVCGNSADAHLK